MEGGGGNGSGRRRRNEEVERGRSQEEEGSRKEKEAWRKEEGGWRKEVRSYMYLGGKGREGHGHGHDFVSHSHAKCIFRWFMWLTLTLWASEARKHCELLRQISNPCKRRGSGEGTIAEVRSLSTKVRYLGRRAARTH